MQVEVDFHNERLDLQVPDERLLAHWHGPEGVAAGDVYRMVCDALENPRRFPPLRQAVVPGDRVVIAVDGDVPELSAVLEAVCDTIGRAGVERESTTVLMAAHAQADLVSLLPPGVTPARHDPDDRKQLAYLSATSEGRRVYLNRLLTDADVVIPIGRLGYDAVLGYRGPWGLIFPGMSDTDTASAFRTMSQFDWPDCEQPRPALNESAEVSWLLGTQFHLGFVAGARGIVETVAGLESAVRQEGTAAVDRRWTFAAEARADVVVAGIAGNGLDHLALALANGVRLVQRGGKLVVLSRVRGTIGPALSRLLELDDARLAPAALRGRESDPDFSIAQILAQALVWSDVYLLSGLDRELLVDTPLIALDRPEEARRLVAASHSSLFLSQAEWARARAADPPD